MEHILQAGFGRCCITPEESVPLQGYGNVMRRMSNNVLSDLYTTCVAFTDAQGQTLLLFHNDLASSGEEISTPARQKISAATGIPTSHILVAATHTHSAPAYAQQSAPCIQRYNDFLWERMLEASQQALADRQPVSVQIAKENTEHLNFVRHYILDDGSYKGDNFGVSRTGAYVGHTTEADPEMRLIRLVRKEKRDIWLVNWQCHPHRTGGSKKYDVSSDIIGVMRQELEAQTDCLFAYFTGGAGNLNPFSRIPEENIYEDYLQSGKALAKHARKAAEKLTDIHSGKLTLTENLHTQPICRPDTALYEQALLIKKEWERVGDFKALIPQCEAIGINSPYAANSIVRRFQAKVQKLNVPMYAFAMGGIAFITAPYEMFDTNAKYIRDNSPFPMTFVITCANDADAYIPSAYGYIHGCYEADNSWFAPGTGEVLAKMYVDMLKDIHKTQEGK